MLEYSFVPQCARALESVMNARLTRKGFTLLELLAVVTLIGIVSAMVITRVSAQALEAKKKCCLQYKGDLNSAIEHYYIMEGAFPAQVSDLYDKYYPEAIPNCPVTNTPYTIDPATNRIDAHNH
jgi:prepilin-type N-terminal cleavage/methylation domain-containing protein